MNFILNKEEISKLDIPVEELLYLLMLYLGKSIDEEGLKDLHSKGYIIEHESTHIPVYTLDRSGASLVESALINSEFKTKEGEKDTTKDLAARMREIFPPGKKPGTQQQWRDSNTVITVRLKSWKKKYNPKFTDDEIVEATQNYKDAFNGDYRYMQLLKYFIYKRKNVGGELEETSQLLSFLENKDAIDIDNDWMLSIK